MDYRRPLTAAIAVLLSLALIGGVTQSFTTSEKQTITALRNRIVTLEAQATTSQANDVAMAADLDTLDGNVQALDARLSALEEAQPAFTFTNVTAFASPPCDPGQCYADISWNVDPPATGQVEWGLTTDYGNLTTLETDLLGFHRQRISGLNPDTTYHYRLIATDGTTTGPVSYHVVS